MPQRPTRSDAYPHWVVRLALGVVVLCVCLLGTFIKSSSDSFRAHVRRDQRWHEQLRVRVQDFARELMTMVSPVPNGEHIGEEEYVRRRRAVLAVVMKAFPTTPGDELLTRRILNLSNFGLKGLPDDLGVFAHAFNGQGLTQMVLSDNMLKTLPDSIGQLGSLEVLYLRGNKLVYLPDSIGQLQNLHRLDVKNNMLENLPSTISRLPHLLAIDASSNDLRELPEEFSKLVAMETLMLGDNSLDGMHSHAVTTMEGLRTLDLHGNNFASLPFVVDTLERLEALEARNNPMCKRGTRPCPEKGDAERSMATAAD